MVFSLKERLELRTMTLTAASHYQKHCPGCFQLKGGVATCPHCGYDESAQRSPLFLPHGTILGGQYRVGRVLGRPGGFGITYLGWDVNLQQRVAIKEYLPREIAQRMPNSLEVNVHTADDKRGFEFGKEQFLREARIVAKLDHPNVVRVRNFFNANSTAYLVMDYYEGMSLGDYLSSVRNKLEPELAVPLVKPILEGLQYVHERGLVHRDLKPHNIYLAAIGRPIVLDFGAARQAAGDRVQSLSVVLTEGYAPLEQYQRRAVQGPWTDVYGVAATLYRMITGAAPPIALDRIGRDPVDDGGWNAVPPALVPALRMALAVRPSDRFQSAIEFRAALDRYLGGAPSTQGPAEIMPAAKPFVPPIAEPPPTSRPRIVTTEAPVTVVAPSPRPSIIERPVTVAEPVPAPVIAPPAVSVPTAAPVTSAAAAAPPAAPPAPRTALPLPPLGTPVSALPPRNALGIHSATGAVAPSALPPGTLHRRVSDFVPPPPPPRKPLHTFGPWVMLAAAGLAIGYVLLNPPTRARPPPVVTPVAAAPVAEPLAPAEPEVREPVPLPSLVALPGGTVALRDDGGDTARSARVSAIKVSRTEVTYAQFADFVRRTGYDNPRWQNYPCESAGGRLPDWQNPGYAQGDESPVVCVSWADANAYTQWLSRETGQHWRLPTEAEWEYAARAGTSSRHWWGSEFDPGMAACQSCPPQVPTQPAATGSYPPNPFGLHETLGNVREWTCSTFEPYSSNAAERCVAAEETARVAVRGGSWQQGVEALAAGYREAYEPYRRNVWTGFRVVQDTAAPVAAAAR